MPIAQPTDVCPTTPGMLYSALVLNPVDVLPLVHTSAFNSALTAGMGALSVADAQTDQSEASVQLSS